MADSISFTVLARDLASRTFREVGREALAMAAKVQAANRAMDDSFMHGGHSQFEMWAKAIIVGLPLIPPLIVAVTVALAGLNSVLMSTIPGVGLLAAAFIANFQKIKNSQPWDELTSAWHRFATATNPAIMAPVTTAMQILTGLLQRGVPIVNAFADALNGFLLHVKQEMQGPAFDKFLNWVRTVGAVNFSNLLRATENLVVGLANLGMAFSQQGLNITQWLVDITGKFRAWSADLMGSGSLGGFIRYFQATWPSLKNLVADFVIALSHIALAVAPLSKDFMNFFDMLLRGFNAIPIQLLTDLAEGFIVAKVAAYGLSAGMAAVNFVMSANPIMLVVVALAALAAGFVVAYNKSETFHTSVDNAFRQISQAARTMYNAVKPVIDWFKSPQGAESMSIAMGLTATGVRLSAGMLASNIHAIATVARPVFLMIAQQCRIISTAFSAAARVIGVASSAIKTDINLVRVAWGIVGNAFSAVGQRIQGAMHAVGNVANALRATISQAMNTIRNALHMAEAAYNALRSAFSHVPNFGWIGTVANMLMHVYSAARTAASGVWSLISAIGHIPSLPSISIPHFAAGGRPLVGQVSLVGERGPELFVADRPGTIIPADQTRSILNSGDGGGAGTSLDPAELARIVARELANVLHGAVLQLDDGGDARRAYLITGGF